MWEFPHQRTLPLLEIYHLFCTNKLHELVVLLLLQTVLGYREVSSRNLPNTENERGTGRNIGVYCNMHGAGHVTNDLRYARTVL
jgi:hypothetical protein